MDPETDFTDTTLDGVDKTCDRKNPSKQTPILDQSIYGRILVTTVFFFKHQFWNADNFVTF